ncbi:hypothetical protein GQX73_g8490 [Xylaria multiplex]|uniref:Uncharacterized protein n=1 Tax=Xylaria multiplex TaxID=323545 RepID=A0A7C8IJC2_9PEZI|nr:hypothetical protein GQX73_g8490 [Xylaria multiplex]
MLWVVLTVCFAFSLLIRLTSALVNLSLTALVWSIFIPLCALGCGVDGYEFLRNRCYQARTTNASNCERCEASRDQTSGLEYELLNARCSNTAYCLNIRKALNERIVELEQELCETAEELERTTRFLRVAETQANEQRANIRSLKEELQGVRDDNSLNSSKKSAMQEDIERLQQQNEQLRANNLHQWNRALEQKQQTVKAQIESDDRGDRIRLLANKYRRIQKELDDARRQLQHQTRRADEQREARIRLEVENEELRRQRTVT